MTKAPSPFPVRPDASNRLFPTYSGTVPRVHWLIFASSTGAHKPQSKPQKGTRYRDDAERDKQDKEVNDGQHLPCRDFFPCVKSRRTKPEEQHRAPHPGPSQDGAPRWFRARPQEKVPAQNSNPHCCQRRPHGNDDPIYNTPRRIRIIDNETRQHRERWNAHSTCEQPSKNCFSVHSERLTADTEPDWHDEGPLTVSSEGALLLVAGAGFEPTTSGL